MPGEAIRSLVFSCCRPPGSARGVCTGWCSRIQMLHIGAQTRQATLLTHLDLCATEASPVKVTGTRMFVRKVSIPGK